MYNPSRALIIDEQKVVRDIFDIVLTHWGIPCSSATSHEAGLDRVKSALESNQGFDLIICEVTNKEDSLNIEAEILQCHKDFNAPAPSVLLLQQEQVGYKPLPDTKTANKLILHKPILISDVFYFLSALQITAHITTLDKKRVRTQLLDRCDKHNWINNPPRILLAEDNINNQLLMQELLKSYQLSLDIAINGKEAVDMVATAEYDIVFMDVQMPDMDGNTATSKIRQRLSRLELPIIGISAASFSSDIEKAYKAGMNSFIPKPITIENLIYIILQYWKPSPNSTDHDTIEHKEIEFTAAITDQDHIVAALKNIENLNSSYLIDIIGENGYVNVITMFTTQTRGLLTEANRDYSTWSAKQKAAFAHRIKGSASNIGALDLINLATKYEQEASDTLDLTPLLVTANKLIERLETTMNNADPAPINQNNITK